MHQMKNLELEIIYSVTNNTLQFVLAISVDIHNGQRETKKQSLY